MAKKTVHFELSSEQNDFIAKALAGNNILVDACIGSGKTTAIQQLCNDFPSDKRILYLTYNRLLKLDAQAKIKTTNTTVTNYHGFAWSALQKNGVYCGITELIFTFNHVKPMINIYDVLILDEYQDIEQEFADMLWYIKSTNQHMQIIAVGDMMQKIYDKTTLNVPAFMEEFLGEHIALSFTKCFRLSAQLAAKLGRIWKKEIIGVNDNCIVEEMAPEAVVEFLSKQKPRDILCLGDRIGMLATVLNHLETHYPEQFNKKTVYASIRDDDGHASKLRKNAAIFTTYDSSKGLERPVCVVFDFTESYWAMRVNYPLTSREILRNIFCVAASRGKQHIVFVNSGEPMLSEESLCSTDANVPHSRNLHTNMGISNMFQFKYVEDVEQCYALLNVHAIRLSEDDRVIHVKNNDELIDLSPCIGVYQEAVFFGERSLNAQIEGYYTLHPKERSKVSTGRDMSLDEKILFLTALQTRQERYRTQVSPPFVPDAEREMLYTRLQELFSPDDEVQIPCKIDFAEAENGPKSFSAIGLADVVKESTVYELKFVSELTYEHFLQCACYMVALNLDKGILWNTRDNSAFEIAIPEKKVFLDAVAKTITKRTLASYYQPSLPEPPKEQHSPTANVFAVIDTETNFDNRVMSVGIVLADANTFTPIDSRYYILPDEVAVRGMFSNALNLADAVITKRCSRKEAIDDIVSLLRKYESTHIFAYNAFFDESHLPELREFIWCDIMWMSAYKQFNPSIPDNAEISKSGRLKRGAGVEPTMQRLRRDASYHETHNALLDALDELEIMRRLGHSIGSYVRPNGVWKNPYKFHNNVSADNSAIDTSVTAASTITPIPPLDNSATSICEPPEETESFEPVDFSDYLDSPIEKANYPDDLPDEDEEEFDEDASNMFCADDTEAPIYDSSEETEPLETDDFSDDSDSLIEEVDYSDDLPYEDEFDDDTPDMSYADDTEIPRRKAFAELDSLISEALLYGTARPIEEVTPLRNYKEAHALLISGKGILYELRKLESIQPSPEKARAALKEFIADEVMKMLLETPIEYLAEIKIGIRVSALKDAGYENMCEICGLDYNQLLSIYGIGPKSAQSILFAVSYLKNGFRDIVTSDPHFTETTCGKKAVREYCSYKWSTKAYNSIFDILAAEKNIFEKYCSVAAPAEYALRWVFTFSRKRKNAALQATAEMQKQMESTANELVHITETLYARCLGISFEDAWADYTALPDEYKDWFSKNNTSDA